MEFKPGNLGVHSLLDHFGCRLHIDFCDKGIAYLLVNHDVARRGRYCRSYRILLGALSLGLFE